MALVLNGTDGSVSVPAMQGSTAGTSTGLYFPATNQAAIATNGTIGLLVDETQSVRINGASASTADSKINTTVTSAGTQITLAELRNLDYTATTKSFLRVRNAVNSAGSTYSSYFGQGADQKTYIIANNGGRGGDIIIDGNNGYVTNPNQVAVSAYNTVSQSVAASTAAVITLGGTRFNIGSAFNTSTNTFTAPVAGYYMCTGLVSWTGTFSSTRQFAMIYKNGSQTDGFGTQNARPSATDLGVSTSGILYLAASDTVQLAGFQESSGPQTILGTGNSTWTNLTIRLLG